MTHGKRAVYRMYALEHGWYMYTTKTGNLKKTWIGDGPAQRNIVGYATFIRFWMEEYSHIHISCPREGICNLCFIFQQCHRYSANHAFMNQPSSENNTSQSEPEDASGNDDTQCPNEIEPQLLDSDVTVEMLEEAARHVKNAKAQREYLQMRERQAATDRKNNVPHASRRNCITLDYCMNLLIPHLGKQQPGATYFMQKWNAYVLGFVNAAHEYTDPLEDHKVGHFMNAYMYPEWEGSKGGNNVASLL